MPKKPIFPVYAWRYYADLHVSTWKSGAIKLELASNKTPFAGLIKEREVYHP